LPLKTNSRVFVTFNGNFLVFSLLKRLKNYVIIRFTFPAKSKITGGRRHIMKVIVILLSFMFLTPVLNGEGVNHKEELLRLDRSLSGVAGKDGVLKAFYPYLAGHSALFPLKGHPLTGKDACKQAMDAENVQLLRWEPLFSRVSAGGDLGHTHGRYKKGDAYGYYGTIWRKMEGKWKVVVSQGLIDLKKYAAGPIDKKYAVDRAKAGKVTKAVLDTEYAFAAHALKHGTVAAFYNYIADDGIALSASGPPNGKEVYKKLLDRPKGKSVLEWEPFYSFVSASAAMAYNYGPYTYTSVAPDGKKQVSYGYFVTVWKKQPEGKWKFVFDGGNVSPPGKNTLKVDK
jgi:ketosteroid isomerase-like protein